MGVADRCSDSRNQEEKMIEGILKKYAQHGVRAPPGWGAAGSAGVAAAPAAAPAAFGQVRKGIAAAAAGI